MSHGLRFVHYAESTADVFTGILSSCNNAIYPHFIKIYNFHISGDGCQLFPFLIFLGKVTYNMNVNLLTNTRP